MRYLSLILGLTCVAVALGVVPEGWADPGGSPPGPKEISVAEWDAALSDGDPGLDPSGVEAAHAIVVTQAAAVGQAVEESEALPAEEAPDEDEASGDEVPEDEASENDDVEALPDLTEGNIFEHLKIELLDLDELGRKIDEKLMGETIRLSLHECVLMALQTNQDVLIVSYEPQKTAAQLRGAKGEFDPILSASATYLHSEQTFPATTRAFLGAGGGGGGASHRHTTVFDGYDDDGNPILLSGVYIPTAAEIVQSTVALGKAVGMLSANPVQVDTNKAFQLALSGKSHWGTQYRLTFDMRREKGTFSGFMSEYSGSVTASLTQPLLRGWGKNVNLIRVRQARIGREIAEAQFLTSVLNTLGEVVRAYWDLVGAIENLQVRQESLDNARRLVEINERRLEIGTAAAIEVLQAKAEVAVRQGQFVTAQTTIADAEDRLKQLLSMRDGELFSSKRIVTTDRPSVFEFDWDKDESMRLALERCPQIRSAQLEVDNARLEEKRARNDLLPQLDFDTSYTQGGRSFILRETFRGIGDKQDFRYNFGLTASIPLGNRSARGSHLNAKIQVRQAEQRLEQAKDNIMFGVRMSARAVLTSQILVESNRQARILQEANVAAEGKRLRLGVTTSHRVLEVQEDLTAAQTQEVQARINFEKSVTDLHVAQNTLFEELGVEVELPEEERPLSFGRSLSPVRVWKSLRD